MFINLYVFLKDSEVKCKNLAYHSDMVQEVVSSIIQCQSEISYPGKQRNISQDLKLGKSFVSVARKKIPVTFVVK